MRTKQLEKYFGVDEAPVHETHREPARVGLAPLALADAFAELAAHEPARRLSDTVNAWRKATAPGGELVLVPGSIAKGTKLDACQVILTLSH